MFRRFDLFSMFVLIVMFAIPAGTITAPLSEYDTGWHLRTGQWIVENRAIPEADTFSTVGQDRLWVAYSWLYDVGVYGAFQTLGLVGILLCRTALALFIVMALYFLVRRREPSVVVQAGIVAAASVALWPLLVSDRPGLVSMIFVIWTLEAILALREGRAHGKIWLLPLVYALWANVHIQWVHGLFIMGLAWLAPLIDAAVARRSLTVAERRDWLKLTALIAACSLATLCNPYHIHLYDVVLTYAQQKEMYQRFEELKSIAFRQPADWFVLGLTCAACFALGRRQKLDTFDMLLLLAGCYFSFHARHDTWFVVLAACVILSRRAGSVSDRSAPACLPHWSCILLLAASVLTARFFLHGISDDRLQTEQAHEFPVAAAEFLENSGLPGPIFNSIDWGGYLIWRLPHYQVGIDGRAQLHGEQRTRRCMDVCEGRPGWSDDPELRGAGVVLLQKNAPLAELLRRDPRWRQVHTSDIAVVFALSGRN